MIAYYAISCKHYLIALSDSIKLAATIWRQGGSFPSEQMAEINRNKWQVSPGSAIAFLFKAWYICIVFNSFWGHLKISPTPFTNWNNVLNKNSGTSDMRYSVFFGCWGSLKSHSRKAFTALAYSLNKNEPVVLFQIARCKT